MITIQAVVSDLLTMNRDALAALVTLGAKDGHPLKYISNETDRFVVIRMINQAAGSI